MNFDPINNAELLLIRKALASRFGREVQCEYLTISDTYTAPHDGVLDIWLQGGSPSGPASGGGGYLSGSGAPEISIKSVEVKAGDQFVTALGAGGLPVTVAASVLANGIDGGTSSVVGPGVNMTAVGGKAGKASATVPVLGGEGGHGGQGGDEHRPGGDGGDVLAATTNASAGSGACNVRGLPKARLKGGDVVAGSTGQAAAGGAGVGGRGASVTGGQAGAGGGYGGPATDGAVSANTLGPNAMGDRSTASPTEIIKDLARSWGLDWFGGGGSTGNAPGPGGGSAGAISSAAPQRPGAFGGPGGVSGTVAAVGQTGNRGPGGPARGVSAAATSGKGADGMAIFVLRKV